MSGAHGIGGDGASVAAKLAAADAPDRDGFARVTVGAAEWTALARACAEDALDLCALWIDGDQARMALLGRDLSAPIVASMRCEKGGYPAVSRFHAPAIRLERAARDLYGVTPHGMPDARGWLDHGVWPQATGGAGGSTEQSAPYAFLPVEGEGLHQVPVGPVHAGIIEPGHFRFTANGETVVRLEERFGYVHKGVEKLLAGKTIDQAARIVARVSGDSTVAYSLAFARAVEAATGIEAPPRATALRAILAELERIAHHISDFGAICNDASAVAIHAHCAVLRERVLQVSAACFGHRLLMDRIAPGGVSVDLSADGLDALRRLLDECEVGLQRAVDAYDGSPSIQDRTVTTGRLSAELASRFAAGGYVGRASGRDFDCRRDLAYPPYDSLHFTVPVRSEGDVNARAWIRIDEAKESISMLRQLFDGLAPGPLTAEPSGFAVGEGAALVEAFRGDVFVAVRLDESGNVARCHARDPSWFQWPLLEAAIEGNIVADFPICNKSFNCSYSGPDM